MDLGGKGSESYGLEELQQQEPYLTENSSWIQIDDFFSFEDSSKCKML